MRKSIIVAALLFIIVILITALALNLNSIVNSNKSYFLDKAEETLGRAISVSDIGISLRGGLGVRLDDFAVSDYPEFSNGNIIEASSVRVNTRIWPLLRRNFLVKSVTLHKPSIRIIRDSAGRLNTINPGTASNQKPGDANSGNKINERGAAALAIAMVNIDDGALYLEDRITDTKTAIKHINSRIEDFDLEKPMNMILRAAFLSEEENLYLRGSFGPLPGGSDVQEIPVDAVFELKRIDFSEIKETFPLPDGIRVLSGTGDLDMRVEGTAGSGKIPPINGRLFSAGGMMNGMEYSDLLAVLAFKGREVVIDSIVFDSLQGSVKSSGNVDFSGRNPRFHLVSRVRDVSVEGAAGVFIKKENSPVKGRISFEIDCTGEGGGWQAIQRSISGSGMSKIYGGSIEGFNIAGVIFNRLSTYPGMSELFSQEIEIRYPEVFKSRNTRFRNWSSDFVIDNGRLKTRNLVLQASDYSLNGRGSIDMNMNLDLNVNFQIGKALSGDLMKKTQIAGYFAGTDGTIVLPLHIGGRPPHVKVSLDEKYLQKVIQKAFLRQGAKKLNTNKLKDIFQINKKNF